MGNKRYLTISQSEDLKDACKTSDERSIVRDLLDTGMTLKDVLKNRSRFHPDLHA